MLLPIGKWYDENTEEYKDRFFLFGTVMKAEYKTVGQKQTPKLTLYVSPGRYEDLITVVMWSYDADKYREVKKFRTIFAEVVSESREYQGKTYTDYKPIIVMFDGEPFGEPAPQKHTRKSKNVEPESQETDDGFFDIPSGDLPF